MATYRALRKVLAEEGYADEIEWAQTVGAPKSAEEMAGEAIWVILNSGMKNQIARQIMDRVWPAVMAGESASSQFGHKGKSAAIDYIWHNRERLLCEFIAADDKVEWCESLPWVGKITKWHLAKNLGVDCAKPDRWLVRLASRAGADVHELCQRLADQSGDRVATVDLVLWRACNLGLFDTCCEIVDGLPAGASSTGHWG